MITFKKNRIIWEILLLWGVWLLITFSLTNGFMYPERFAKHSLSTLIGFIIIIQINARYLLPKFFLQKKHTLYIIGSLLVVATTVFVMSHDIFPWSDWFRPRPLTEVEKLKMKAVSNVKWMKELTPLIIALLGSTLLGVNRFATKKEKEAIHLENEKLETELKFLKSQVNPHFLFNALNNIYSLAVMKAPQTPESVMQLSEILRYMVYDSNEDKVPLENEINYIENFVELKLLKDRRGMDVQLDLNSVTSNVMIAPMLFIPFVENAFKHSKIENLKKGFIKINLKADHHKIEFQVVNSLPENNFTKDSIGGVGLENIKKRLELIYPEKHELTINQTKEEFEVLLKIFKL